MAWQEAVVAAPLIVKLFLTFFQICARKRLASSRSGKSRRARREDVIAIGGEGGEGGEGGKGGEGGGEGGKGGGGVEARKRDRRRAGDVLNEVGRRGAAINSMSLIEVSLVFLFPSLILI